MYLDKMEEDSSEQLSSKRIKRFRSRQGKTAQRAPTEEPQLREMIFLRDLHFGFLPDDCEVEFADCFDKIAHNDKFAAKCFRLALLSRNEDLVQVLLDHLIVTKDNFHKVRHLPRLLVTPGGGGARRFGEIEN